MDIIKKFTEYLPEWCKENKKPIPPEGSHNKVWQMAWEDFMKSKLVSDWEEHKQQYWNLQLLTKKEQDKRKKESSSQEENLESNKILSETTQNDENESSWDKVQKYLN